jgi:hypothetical protein
VVPFLTETDFELGRLERTLFTLQYLKDTELRRRIHVGLNKGEARTALARAVFFNRLGELRDRTHENQRHRASGLNLVVASIVLWNTVYLERAVTALRERGQMIPDELLGHLAPLGWEHINLTGDYVWKPRGTTKNRPLHQLRLPINTDESIPWRTIFPFRRATPSRDNAARPECEDIAGRPGSDHRERSERTAIGRTTQKAARCRAAFASSGMLDGIRRRLTTVASRAGSPRLSGRRRQPGRWPACPPSTP